MNAVSYDQPDPSVRKTAGDVYLSKKTGTTKRGREISVRVGVGNITPAGIHHAVNQEATHRAAVEIERSLGLHYTVPTTLAQEVIWAHQRRGLGKDSAYNAARRQESAAEPKVRTRKEKPQPGLFD